MDSLTQIVLGAACGEAVAGKKIGNRAMLWGAIGGTIPDLDVFATFLTDELTATSFHRGFMHSMLFAALAPWVLARMVQWFYEKGHYKNRGYKIGAMTVWIAIYFLAATGINFIPVMLGEGLSWYVFLPTLALGLWFVRKLWRDYLQRDFTQVEAPYVVWVSLFFWSIFTHPILDCFTNFGTQVWQPFSDYRVQWNSVSVVDPLATVPFGICLMIASRFSRGARLRFGWNWAGILWFCGYLGYTMWHKSVADRIFEDTLEARNIRYHRYMTNPSIFNNIVWYGIAEGDTAYYFGMYGFNDTGKSFRPISVLPKNHELLDPIGQDTRAGYFLRWFSNGYYTVNHYNGDTLQVNDLRFGLLGDSLTDNNYVFPFLVFKNERGEWDIKQNNRNRSSVKGSEASFEGLWKRVKGEGF